MGNIEQPDASQLVVYTALFGDYEELVEQPMARESNARFVCFTDSPSLTSSTWEIRLIDPTIAWDSTRMARKVKILGYKEFPESAETLWIDNRVVLRTDPSTILERYLGIGGISLPLHSHRDTVRDEFSAVLAAGFDDPARVREQLYYLEERAPSVLDEAPYWTAIILRRASPEVDRAMDVWFDLVMRHSRRDQLSINYALSVAGVQPSVIAIENTESELHTWLRVGTLPKRKDVLFSRSWRYRLGPHVYDAIFVSRAAIALRTRMFNIRKALAGRRFGRGSE